MNAIDRAKLADELDAAAVRDGNKVHLKLSLGLLQRAAAALRAPEAADYQRIFANWMNPQYMKLHAGEMTAQEVRTVRAVLECIKAEIDSSAPEAADAGAVAWRMRYSDHKGGFTFWTYHERKPDPYREAEIQPLYASPSDAGLRAPPAEPMTVDRIDAAFASYEKTLTVIDPKADQQSFSQGYVAGWNAKECHAQADMRERVEQARQEVVLAIAFLGRDAGTDRIKSTVEQIITKLVKADEILRALPASGEAAP